MIIVFRLTNVSFITLMLLKFLATWVYGKQEIYFDFNHSVLVALDFMLNISLGYKFTLNSRVKERFFFFSLGALEGTWTQLYDNKTNSISVVLTSLLLKIYPNSWAQR